ncbi:MAG TPA: phosphopantetheine-binding protein, partial [Candidatus Dormibacteraeota bacterium]|nr:phosphopantetheine-binding protein [Candidatus Dormibacteraeota bacterium]
TSMTLLALRARLAAILERPVAVVELFTHPTIRAFVDHLEPAVREDGDEIERADAEARAQRRRRAAAARAPRTRGDLE